MPPPQQILETATVIANDWWALAFAWHLLVGALLVAVLIGWRPSVRLLAMFLIAPLVSVSAAAWTNGNPFNGSMFGILVVALAAIGRRVPREPARLAPPSLFVSAAAMIVFGWIYPHFLKADSWIAYAYASPFGLLPCPTLSVVIGMTLLFEIHRPATWSTLIGAAGLAYGMMGVVKLGVSLDYGLLAGATVLLGTAAVRSGLRRSVHAERDERTRVLPGDEFVDAPLGTLTHAITLRAAPHDVWPWLVQMGAGTRAGWYSYDFLDNGHRRSATRIVPELQHIGVGTLFPALPGVTDAFTVLAFRPDRELVLGWLSPEGAPLVTWAFVLEPRGAGSTRLIVRARGAAGYRFHGLPPSVSKHVVRLVHFVMQRRQLIGIARRAESELA